MGYIYAYSPDASDCSNIGLVGALMPKKTEFEIQGGEFGEFTMIHPIDEYGKWRALQDGVILKMMVPVRLAPEIKNGAYVTTVEKWKVSNTATKEQRYIYSAATDGKKTKLLNVGTAVTVVSKGNERYKIKTGKYSGWIDFEGLEFEIQQTVHPNQSGIEDAQPSYAVRQQLFRIYEVIPSDNAREKVITVRARRIVYDLLGNISTYINTGALTCQQALSGLLNNCAEDHPFTAYTDIGDSRTAVDFRDMNPIQAMIDPYEGIASRWGGQVICDDYDIYILRKAGMNRGTTVEYRKNMTGVKCTINTSKVATAIRPRGETKAGDPLYLAGNEALPSGYRFGAGKSKDVIYSEAAANYAIPKILNLECDDCKVDDDVTTALARTRMVEQTIAKFESGCALPEISLDVDFIMLGDTEEFSQYRHLEPLFIYDTVPIKHPRIGVYANVECSLLKWDPTFERVISSKFGALTNSTASIANWQISSLSGGKIIPYSIGSQQMSDQVINARHMQADSVNAEAIQSDSITSRHIVAGLIAAEAITAVKAALNEITADTIETDELYAAIAHIFELAADSIEAGDIETDELAAVMAQIGTANIKRANISYAQIVDIFSERIFTDSGTAGKFRADNLEVTQAQIVDLIVGSFRIVSGDGKVYNVTIDAEGNLKTEYLYDESEWMENGEIPDGYSAVAGNLTVGDVTAGNLYVSGAAEIMKLTAKWLVADQAWINELTAGLIKSDLGERLNLYSNEAIVGIVETNNEMQQDVTILSTQFEQTTERFQLEINSKVGAEDLRYYLRYQEGTAELGASDNRYKLQAAANGVFILQDNDVMTRMEQNTVGAPVFDVGRMLRFAPHEIKVSASGVLLFN